MTEQKNTNKQTGYVLLFQRLDNNDEQPKGKKKAFKDHKGKIYMLRVKRYYFVDKHYNVKKYIYW